MCCLTPKHSVICLLQKQILFYFYKLTSDSWKLNESLGTYRGLDLKICFALGLQKVGNQTKDHMECFI